MESAIWGLIGTIVGALASMITTILSTRNSAWLHNQAAEQEKEERKRAFQRKTLIELQNVIHDLMRLITKAHLEDAKAHYAGGIWGGNFLSEEVSSGQRLARRKLVILIERIANDDLREKLKIVNAELSNSADSENLMDSEHKLHAAASKVTNVMEHIGQVLRSQY